MMERGAGGLEPESFGNGGKFKFKFKLKSMFKSALASGPLV